MGKFKTLTHTLALVVAAVYLFVLAALGFKLILTRPFPATLNIAWLASQTGAITLYVASALAFLLGVYFLMRLWGHLGQQRRFSREGLQGPIEVSTQAIEDFVYSLLRQEALLERSRVSLQHAPEGGLDIALNVALKVDASMVETAERLQQQLKREIEGRLGIDVHRVAVYARRIGAPSPLVEQAPMLEGTGALAEGDRPYTSEVKGDDQR